MKKDNRLIALLSVFGIFLVVLGHSGFKEPVVYSVCFKLHDWIYAFHMPLFFFISGYLYSYTNADFLQIDIKKALVKKVKRLLFPYFVLGSIIFCIKYLFASLSYTEHVFSFKTYLEMFIAPRTTNSPMGYLWFLLTLFMIFCIVYGLTVVKIDLRKKRFLFTVVLFSFVLNRIFPNVLWLHFSAVMFFFPYFLMGIWFHNNQSKVETVLHLRSFCVCIFLGFLTLCPIVFTAYTNNFVSIILYSFIGILFSVSFCYFILRFYKKQYIVFSKYTYSIYLLSWFGQYGLQGVLLNILGLEVGVYLLPLLFLAGIFFPLLICKFVEKIKFNKFNHIEYLRLLIGL